MIDETTIIHCIPCFFFLVFGQARSFSIFEGRFRHGHSFFSQRSSSTLLRLSFSSWELYSRVHLCCHSKASDHYFWVAFKLNCLRSHLHKSPFIPSFPVRKKIARAIDVSALQGKRPYKETILRHFLSSFYSSNFTSRRVRMAFAKAVTYVENFILSCSFYPLISSGRRKFVWGDIPKFVVGKWSLSRRAKNHQMFTFVRVAAFVLFWKARRRWTHTAHSNEQFINLWKTA